MEVIVTIFIILLVVAAVAAVLGVKAHQQDIHVLSLPPERTLSVARSAFGGIRWAEVTGQGTFTMARRAVLERNRYHISVDVTPASKGSQVDVWMSYGATAIGMTPAASLGVLQARRKVARLLAEAF